MHIRVHCPAARHEEVDERVATELGGSASFHEGTIEQGLLHVDVRVDETRRDDLACGIDDGELYCWGYNAYGNLGLGSSPDSNIPLQVGGETDWVSVSVGEAPR